MVTTVTAVTTENKQGETAMSYLVLHMDKFKKDAIRGIQSAQPARTRKPFQPRH